MRPQGVAGALVVVAIGAILTYTVSFTISGISIHTVGVIIMLFGAIGLGILLVRSVATSRRPVKPRQRQNMPDPSADGVYRQDPVRGAPPLAATRTSADAYTAAEQWAGQPLNGEEGYRRPETPRH